ncbi:hypothetical protein, conserved in T. vivax [Trypanosoma vivax Y486]|uniref:Trypanosome variant surface glycoprotein B-type N-terminal domain-containing protein n=1 Tax=Trypanosoma vivax (strain Y486) TaxID=1055687 RepID=F9WV83_TRYVY|nr:hypothetical protein, conserved in T. vivax [Trypanosoma vivax Y486]|eukprot:CCD21489.1 hypothetical protein, conserved in T. vivax [Trypanosoma vivax Y486]
MPCQLRVAAWLLCAALCTRVGEGLGATKGQAAADFLLLCRAKRVADEAVLAATGAAGRVARCRDALWQAKKEHVSRGSVIEVNTTNAAQLCATGARPECDAWRWSTEAANGAAEVKKLSAEAVLAGADTEEGAKATGELFKTTMGGSTSENTGWGGGQAGTCLASDMIWLCNSGGNGQAGTRWFKDTENSAPCAPEGNLTAVGIAEKSGPGAGLKWTELKPTSGANAEALATNWRIVQTICEALLPVTHPEEEAAREAALLVVANRLGRAMDDFDKALHGDDDTKAANVQALGAQTKGGAGCTGKKGGSDSSACVGYDTKLDNTRDLTKIPWFAKLKKIEHRLASLAAVELQCEAAERSARHASDRRKRHGGQRTKETANEAMRNSAQGANTPARQAHGAAQLDSKSGQTAHSGDETVARTGIACNEAHPRWHAGSRTCGDEENTQRDNTVRTPNVLSSLATLATALAATTRKDVRAK